MSGNQSSVGFAPELKTTSLPTVTDALGTSGVPNKATVTTSAAHGIAIGARVKMTGFDDDGYNTIVTVIAKTSTTFTFQTPVGAALPHQTGADVGTIVFISQVGTPTPVTRFLEHATFTMDPKPERLYGNGMGAGRLVKRKDRVVPYPKEFSGDWTFPALTDGMGALIVQAMGAVATTGPNGDGFYSHLITIAKVIGQALTVQANKPDELETDNVETYFGCKFTTLKFDLQANGLLIVSLGVDALGMVTNVPLAELNYSTTAELMSFFGGQLTMDGETFANVTQLSIEINLNLETSRRFIGMPDLAEQRDKGDREIKISLQADYRGVQVVDKVRATIPADAIAHVVATFYGPTETGATTPSISFDMPNLIVEEAPLPISDPGLLKLNFTGQALDTDMTEDDALAITLVTIDSVP